MLPFIRFHPRSDEPAGAASSGPRRTDSLDAGRTDTGRALRAENAELVLAAAPALLGVGSGQLPGRQRNAAPWLAWRASGSNEGVGDAGSGPVSGPGALRLPGCWGTSAGTCDWGGTGPLPPPRNCLGMGWTWPNHVVTVSAIQFYFLSPIDITLRRSPSPLHVEPLGIHSQCL